MWKPKPKNVSAKLIVGKTEARILQCERFAQENFYFGVTVEHQLSKDIFLRTQQFV